MKSTLLLCTALLAVMCLHAQSLLFNNSNYVQLGNPAPLQLRAFTLEAWIMPLAGGSTAGSGVGGINAVPILAKGRGESDAPESRNLNYLLGLTTGMRLTADFEESAGRNHPIVSKATLATGTWTHVAVSYEPVSAVWRLYINGMPDTARDLGSNIYPASGSIQPASIATALNSLSEPQGFFSGRIDEIRIWNLARSAAAIRDNYRQQLGSGTGLVARFALNERGGSTAPNSITTTGNGSLVNGPRWVPGFNNTAPLFTGTVSPAHSSNIANSEVTLQVSVTDNNNDQLEVGFFARRKKTAEKFSMVLLPDTQFYTAEPQGKNGGTNSLFKSQTAWIAANRATRNIVYVGHLGDCVENADRYEMEWRRADTALRTLESATQTGLREGLPFGVCVGNHDQQPFGDPKGSTTLYNKYLGSNRFSNRSYYGGHSGTNNDNHYQRVHEGGIDFLILCPEYDQTTGFSAAGGVLDWMESLVKTHSNHKVIVLSHHVLTIDGTFTTQGRAIFNRLKAYPGFILMMGGHITQGEGESRRTDTVNGRLIHTLASDYQIRTRGGNGLLRILEFDPATNGLSVQTYSPYTKTFETDANSQFMLSINLQTPTLPFQQVKRITGLAPGATARTILPVAQNATYEWYATVKDGALTTRGTTRQFTTNYSTATTSVVAAKEPAPEMHTGNSNFSVYPNPTSNGNITLHFPEPVMGTVQVEVWDNNGRLYLRRQLATAGYTATLVHALQSGTYLLRVVTPGWQAQQKMVVGK